MSSKNGGHAGTDGVDGVGGPVEGGGRGLWDEAAAGDVSALAAALSEGGGGDVHACNADGETIDTRPSECEWDSGSRRQRDNPRRDRQSWGAESRLADGGSLGNVGTGRPFFQSFFPAAVEEP